MTLAIATGIAGLSIEDRDLRKPSALYDKGLSIERIRAARRAIDASGARVVLVARTEGLLSDPSAVTHAIEKLVTLADAGADCLFAPGVTEVSWVTAVSVSPRSATTCASCLAFAFNLAIR